MDVFLSFKGFNSVKYVYTLAVASPDFSSGTWADREVQKVQVVGAGFVPLQFDPFPKT